MPLRLSSRPFLRRFALAFVWGLVFPLLLPRAEQAFADHRIVVVCDDNYPPYCFRDPTGKVQGIIPDQWVEWSHVTGIPVEFHGMDWNACQAAMADGSADVIDSAFKTPERERSLDFLDPYVMIKVPIFFHQSISGINRPEDLRGFRVAAKEGDACIGVLRSFGVDDIVQYSDYESIILAAARGEVRIFCVDEPPALYFLYKHNLDASFRSALSLYTGKFHRAVRKDRASLADGSDLFAVLKAGFEAIPSSEYRRIDRRWFGSSLDRRINPTLFLAAIGALLALALLLGTFSLALKSQVTAKTADLSRKAAALEASERKNRAFIQALPDLFLIMDRDCRYLWCKTANPELLRYPETDFIGKTQGETGFPPDIAELFRQCIAKALAEPTVAICEYELDVRAGRRSFEARVVKMEENQVLVIVRDITARAVAERKNAAALLEKEILIKEVHHRVKNNMQVVSGLLRLQSDSLKNDEDRALFEEMQQRIKSMALIHERLYRSEDLSSIDAADYIRSIVEDLSIAYLEFSGSVRTEFDLDPCDCSMDTAVPLGLIVNEVVSNSFKYAFRPSGGGLLTISLKKRADGQKVLTMADDGPGLPEDWECLTATSLGMTLVKLLASQIGAELTITGTKGTRVELSIDAAIDA